MTTATPQRPEPRPIKGSWEDLHAQAQQLARNFNDAAIPIYERVFHGLAKLPPAARAAGDNRLYDLMMTTGVELQGYFNLRDRYEDSHAVIDKMLTLVAPEDRPQIVELKSDVLIEAGRGEDAIALIRELIASADVDEGDWGQLVSAYIRIKQPENALAAINEMDEWINQRIGDGVLAGQEITETRYYQERLRAAALLELGRIDEVVTLFNELYSIDGAAAISPHLVYTRLLQEGMYREALRYIDRDQERQVRAAFWRGLAYHYMGEEARARRIWEDALNKEFVQGDMESIVEHILTLYYLGDPKGEGLEVMLRAQREQTRLSWLIFMLTGLGWLLRGDERAAHTNFKIAISQIKSMGEGKTLAHQYWRFVKDLVPADRAARFAAYFDTRETPQAAQTDETSQEETPQEETTVQPNAPESGSEA